MEVYNELLGNIKGTEKDIVWFWKELDENTESIYSMIFFKFRFLKFLNYNESLMMIYNIYNMFVTPVMSALSPLSTFIILFVLKLYYKIKIPIKQIFNLLKNTFFKKVKNVFSNMKMFLSMSVWFFFYIYSVYQSISYTLQINRITNIFHNKLNQITKFLKNTEKIYNLNSNLYENDLDFNSLLPSLKHKLFDTEPSLFTNKGKITTTYYTILNIKDKLLPFIYYIGHIDSLYSSAVLYKKYDYSLPNYINNKKPILNIKESWHPYLTSDSTKNSLDIKKNIIITGPNAAGKSTFIKTLMLNILLSQTISVSSSNEFNFTPMDILNTYLHIPDIKGKESLFEAELNRCIKFLKKLKTSKDKKSFIIMDELFSSTNPIEGSQAANKICKEIDKYNNNITVLTTHYSDLSKLEKTNNFINYKFLIKRNKKKKIIFTYILKKGISNDCIALELLSNKINIL